MFFSSILVITAISCGVVYIISYLYNWNEYRKIINKIPGPPSWPIIGNVPHFMGSPVEVFKQLRKIVRVYGRCGKIWLFHMPFVILTSVEDIEQIISTTKNNTKTKIYDLLHCWLGTGLLTSNGEKWQTRRKILTPSFHFNILQEFLPVLVQGPETALVRQKFAMMEMKVAIVGILKNFILEAEDIPESIELMVDLVLRPSGALKINFKHRII